MTHAMTEPRITREEIEALLKLAGAATPLDFSTAQKVRDSDEIVCPTCDGDGCVPAKDWCNIDGHAIGIQVYGIGDQMAAMENFVYAANPATLKALCTLALQALDMEPRQDGNRPLPFDRNQLGRFVREAWVRWAQTQPNPKPSWLVPYDELSEPDKEADRQIGETVARWTLIGDAAAITSLPEPRR